MDRADLKSARLLFVSPPIEQKALIQFSIAYTSIPNFPKITLSKKASYFIFNPRSCFKTTNILIMKKPIYFVLVAAIVFAFFSCKNDSSTNTDDKISADVAKEEATTPTAYEASGGISSPFNALSHLPDTSFRKVFTTYPEAYYNTSITIDRYESNDWMLIVREDEEPSVIHFTKTYILLDAKSKDVVMVERQRYHDEEDVAMGRSDKDIPYKLEHHLIDFSGNKPNMQGVVEVAKPVRVRGEVLLEKTMANISHPMEPLAEPADYLKGSYWLEQAGGAIKATPVTAWVDHVNIRFQPKLNGEVTDQVSEGTVLPWTGKKSENTSTVKLRGKEYTDYWYELEPIEREMGFGWVFGGAINRPGEAKKGSEAVPGEAKKANAAATGTILDFPYFGKIDLSTWKKQKMKEEEAGDFAIEIQAYTKGNQILEYSNSQSEYNWFDTYQLYNKNKKLLKKRELYYDRGDNTLTETIEDFTSNPPMRYKRSQKNVESAEPYTARVKGNWKKASLGTKKQAPTKVAKNTAPATDVDFLKVHTLDLGTWKLEKSDEGSRDVGESTAYYSKGNRTLKVYSYGHDGFYITYTLLDKSGKMLKTREAEYSDSEQTLRESVDDFTLNPQMNFNRQQKIMINDYFHSDRGIIPTGKWNEKIIGWNENASRPAGKGSLDKNAFVIQLTTFGSRKEFEENVDGVNARLKEINLSNVGIYTGEADGLTKVYLFHHPQGKDGPPEFFTAGPQAEQVLRTLKGSPYFRNAFRRSDVNKRSTYDYNSLDNKYYPLRPTEYAARGPAVNTSNSSTGPYKIQLGVFSERKTKVTLDRSFGFSKLGMKNFGDLLSHDFTNVNGKVYRRYYYGSFGSHADALADKQALERMSNQKLVIVKK